METPAEQVGYSPINFKYFHLEQRNLKMFHVKQLKNFKKGDPMEIETAIEYLTDIINVYLEFLPLTKYTKQEVKKALYLAISALKTIDDMHSKGE